jgi:AmiR/NasT family two-component response regulator
VDSSTDIRGLAVLLADEDEQALAATAGVVRGLGHEVTAHAVSVTEASERIAADEPDLSIVVVHHDEQHALDLVEELAESASGPVVVLLEDGGGDVLRRAAERGIDAYARSDEPGEVQTAIELAMRRHLERAALTEQVAQLEGALERRLTIERAKGILMERHGLDERSAFGMLREHARGRGRRVVDVAHSIVEGHGLLPGRARSAGDD